MKRFENVTFPGSGKTARLPVVSVATIAMKMQRKYPRPKPPKQTIDGITEYNYSHPDYVEKVRVWDEFISTQAAEVALRKIADFKLTKAQKAEVEAWKKKNPLDWDDDDPDHSLWLEEIGLSDDGDFKALMVHAGIGDPDKEAVESTKEGF